MKNKYDHIDLIEKYLDDDLDQSELEVFNKLLNTDRDFNKLFFEMDSLLDGIRRTAAQTSMEEKLKNLEMALPDQNRSPESNIINEILDRINSFFNDVFFRLSMEYRRSKMIVATAIVALLLSSTFIYNLVTTVSPAKLYVNNFIQPEYPFGGTMRSFDDEKSNHLSADELFNGGIYEYNNYNYGQALVYFYKIKEKDHDAKVSFFSGICFMKTEQFEKAKTLLKTVSADAESYWSSDAEYFLALCYLHDENIDLAIPLLKSVAANEESDYKTKAQKMLKKL